jgi:preprotein translocase subunit SecD
MKRTLLWRGLLILAVVLSAAAAAYPPQQKINLGLDLRGGMHLLLQVHTEDALRAETELDMRRLVQQAKDDKLADLKPQRTGDSEFQVSGLAPDARTSIAQISDKVLQRWNRHEDGDKMVFTMRGPDAVAVRDGAVHQAVETIRNRIDAFGVTEPTIQEAGNQRIIVQLPGVDDPERVRRLIKNTAFLEFRITTYPERGGNGVAREEILSHYNGKIPDDVDLVESSSVRQTADGAPLAKTYYAVEKRSVVTGRDLSTARPSQGKFGGPVVSFSMKPDGARMFGQLTGANVHRGLAILLDGKVVSAPVINERISDSGVIEGNFTEKEVEDLSTVLRSGSLPASITYLEERTVGPSLGRDSVESGLRAGILGTSLVIVVMLLVYNLAGVNAIAALVLNVLMLFGGMGLFHSTLTLPGIAGVILTIGMAVDANVLVFERIREELRAGRTVRAAIDLGFDRAFTSIIDTHVTTLVSAMFLFQFGTGPIKGFAVTLTIGLLASLFTSVFVSRWIFDLVLSRRRVQNLSI